MKPLLITLLLLTSTLSATTPTGARGAILCEIPNSKRHVSIYINAIWDDSKACSEFYNIPHALIIAQMCLETGYGRSKYAKQKNHLGIKFEGQYAHFKTVNDCLEVYGRTLHCAKCYRNLQPQTIDEWLAALKCCGYFTSKKYEKKIKSIIKTYNLDWIDG